MTREGLWVFVCGPSGAGKDSVIDLARMSLEDQWRIVFTRRICTRAAGPADDHEEISRAEFARRRDAGELSWHWEAHGHAYGISRDYAKQIDEGRIVVVNGSREHAAKFADLPSVRVALVTAPPAAVEQRLLSRAREDGEGIRERLARNASLGSVRAHLHIDNSGALARASAQLAHWLLALSHA